MHDMFICQTKSERNLRIGTWIYGTSISMYCKERFSQENYLGKHSAKK